MARVLPVIDVFQKLGAAVEIVAIHTPHRDRNGDWRVKVLFRDLATRNSATVVRPIGELPLYAPGRIFRNGRLTEDTSLGRTNEFILETTANHRSVALTEVPSNLLAQLASKELLERTGLRQKFLCFRAADGEIYVPVVEFLRFLYLHSSVLANVVMRPQGLLELYDLADFTKARQLSVTFSDQVPVSLLRGRAGTRFAALFSWIAFHSEGRAGWNSIRKSVKEDGLWDVIPPTLINSHWRTRSLISNGTALIFEITQMNGLEPVREQVFFRHPRLKRYTSEDSPKSKKKRKISSNEIVPDDSFVAENSVSKSKADPPIARLAQDGPTFSRPFSIVAQPEKVQAKHREIQSEEENGQTESSEIEVGREIAGTVPEGAKGNGGNRTEVGRQVSAGEPGEKFDSHTRIEFTLLEKAKEGNVGELGALIAVLEHIRDIRPKITVAYQLTPLRDGKRISLASINPVRVRPALVAFLWPANSCPRVLIDIDHSGGLDISMLYLRYVRKVRALEVERDAKQLMDRAVDLGGRWDFSVVQKRNDTFVVKRLQKVLRNPKRFDDKNYIHRWALRILRRM